VWGALWAGMVKAVVLWCGVVGHRVACHAGVPCCMPWGFAVSTGVVQVCVCGVGGTHWRSICSCCMANSPGIAYRVGCDRGGCHARPYSHIVFAVAKCLRMRMSSRSGHTHLTLRVCVWVCSMCVYEA